MNKQRHTVNEQARLGHDQADTERRDPHRSVSVIGRVPNLSAASTTGADRPQRTSGPVPKLLRSDKRLGLFSELKRRRVFRVAGSYLVTAWLLAQIAQLLCEGFGTPNWVFQAVLMSLAAGFPVALLLAWVYEITADGIRLDSEVDPTRPASNRARQIDFVIIAVLAITVVLLLITRESPVCTLSVSFLTARASGDG